MPPCINWDYCFLLISPPLLQVRQHPNYCCRCWRWTSLSPPYINWYHCFLLISPPLLQVRQHLKLLLQVLALDKPLAAMHQLVLLLSPYQSSSAAGAAAPQAAAAGAGTGQAGGRHVAVDVRAWFHPFAVLQMRQHLERLRQVLAPGNLVAGMCQLILGLRIILVPVLQVRQHPKLLRQVLALDKLVAATVKALSSASANSVQHSS